MLKTKTFIVIELVFWIFIGIYTLFYMINEHNPDWFIMWCIYQLFLIYLIHRVDKNRLKRRLKNE